MNYKNSFTLAVGLVSSFVLVAFSSSSASETPVCETLLKGGLEFDLAQDLQRGCYDSSDPQTEQELFFSTEQFCADKDAGEKNLRLLLSKQLGTYEIKDGPNVEGVQICHLRANNEDPELEPLALTEQWPYDTASPNEFSIALLPVGLGQSIASVLPGKLTVVSPDILLGRWLASVLPYLPTPMSKNTDSRAQCPEFKISPYDIKRLKDDIETLELRFCQDVRNKQLQDNKWDVRYCKEYFSRMPWVMFFQIGWRDGYDVGVGVEFEFDKKKRFDKKKEFRVPIQTCTVTFTDSHPSSLKPVGVLYNNQGKIYYTNRAQLIRSSTGEYRIEPTWEK